MSLPRPTPLNAPQVEGLTVFVRGLALEAAIGIHGHERGRTQPLIVDVELTLAPHPVHGLADTYDYEGVAEVARALVAEGHIGLVETFAERLADAILGDARVRRVVVEAAKPEALAGARVAGCRVALSR